MQTLPLAMSLTAELLVGMSSGSGVELSAGSLRSSHRSRSQRVMRNMFPSLKLLANGMWLRSIMSELGFAPNKPITLFGDNQTSISIAKDPMGHTRAKQIDIRFHYLRELVERDIISIEYIATNSMPADGLRSLRRPH